LTRLTTPAVTTTRPGYDRRRLEGSTIVDIPKPTDADKARFRSLVEDLAGVEVKAMFGNLGAFMNGNMFAGLFGPDIGVKLADDDRTALIAAGGGPFGPSERPMSGYVTLPPGLSAGETREQISNAQTHVAAMPPKKPQKTKKATS
jgi:TfoX/Sxy family transcriptional regulator of competence genes